MRRVLLPTILLVTALSLAGCTTSQSASDSAVPAVPGVDQSVAESSVVGDAAGPGADLAARDRSVVSTGSVTVTAERPLDAAAQAVRIVERAGGRVDARTETAPRENDRGSANLTLRIPSSDLTAILDELTALGTDADVAITTVDVTAQTQDLDARISALSASVERLTALLASASDTKVLIELETAISERQGSLESMQAQQRSLADQVSLSTIDLALISVADAPVEQPDTFWSGLAAGWGALSGFAGLVLVALGVLLPWIGVAAVAAAVTLLVLRRRRATRPAA